VVGALGSVCWCWLPGARAAAVGMSTQACGQWKF
jgi:hypothetical protein